ncbi:MAG: hypothetical protein Q9M32_00460 [Sulfurimonas sp.]|nr:hypothetical protein [Sulfurimonas sp.]MDQ7061638.1 hypothetical protein [Sulfurimonas sp.]
MDSEILYSIFGVVGLVLVGYLTLTKTSKQVVRTKEEKRLDIVSEYKKGLQKSLKSYEIGDEARKAKKIMVLREYSEKLHKNIFFDDDEVQKIINELAAE